MRDRARSIHTFEPLKATLDFEVFKLALEARRLAEADARLQQARQEAATRNEQISSSPTSKVATGSDVAETLDPGSTVLLDSRPAFSVAGFAGPTADAQPQQSEGELEPCPGPSPLDTQAKDTAAHASAGQPTNQNPVDDQQDAQSIQQQRSTLQMEKHELLLKQAARSDEIESMCKELQQLQASRDDLLSQLDQVRSWQV